MAEVTFLAPDTDAFVDSVRRHVDDYEAASGDRVRLEIIDSDSYFSNRIQDYLTGSAPIDVFMSGPVLLWEHVGAGLVEPLDEYVSSAGAGYSFSDFIPNLITANRWTGRFGSPLGDGPLLEIPVNCESYNLAWNKPVLERYGIEVPRTWEAYFAAAREAVSRSGGAVRGFGQRGIAVWHTMYTGFATQFWSYGATDFDENGNCAIASAVGIAATEDFVSALRDAGPQDWLNQRWYELAMEFGAGDYTLIVDSDHYVAFFEDPAISAMAGQIGYALPPVGPGGAMRPNLWTWSMAMNSRSTNKAAAWSFMEWATGPEFLLATAFEGNLNPTRTSTWDNSRFAELARPWGDFAAVSRDLIENLGRVLVTPVSNYREIGNRWADALRSAYSGAETATALRDAARDIDALTAGARSH